MITREQLVGIAVVVIFIATVYAIWTISTAFKTFAGRVS